MTQLNPERLRALLALGSEGPWRFVPNPENDGWLGVEGPGSDVLVVRTDAQGKAWIPFDGICKADRELIERAPQLAREMLMLYSILESAMQIGGELAVEVEKLRKRAEALERGPAHKLLAVLRDLDSDGALQDVYGIGADPGEPLALALEAWASSGYPGAGAIPSSDTSAENHD